MSKDTKKHPKKPAPAPAAPAKGKPTKPGKAKASKSVAPPVEDGKPTATAAHPHSHAQTKRPSPTDAPGFRDTVHGTVALHPCMCGCGQRTALHFAVGHHRRFNRWLKEIKGGSMAPKDHMLPQVITALGPWVKSGKGLIPAKLPKQIANPLAA